MYTLPSLYIFFLLFIYIEFLLFNSSVSSRLSSHILQPAPRLGIRLYLLWRNFTFILSILQIHFPGQYSQVTPKITQHNTLFLNSTCCLLLSKINCIMNHYFSLFIYIFFPLIYVFKKFHSLIYLSFTKAFKSHPQAYHGLQQHELVFYGESLSFIIIIFEVHLYQYCLPAYLPVSLFIFQYRFVYLFLFVVSWIMFVYLQHFSLSLYFFLPIYLFILSTALASLFYLSVCCLLHLLVQPFRFIYQFVCSI